MVGGMTVKSRRFASEQFGDGSRNHPRKMIVKSDDVGGAQDNGWHVGIEPAENMFLNDLREFVNRASSATDKRLFHSAGVR